MHMKSYLLSFLAWHCFSLWLLNGFLTPLAPVQWRSVNERIWRWDAFGGLGLEMLRYHFILLCFPFIQMKLVLYCSFAGLSTVITTLGFDMSRGLRRAGEPLVSGNDLCVRQISRSGCEAVHPSTPRKTCESPFMCVLTLIWSNVI